MKNKFWVLAVLLELSKVRKSTFSSFERQVIEAYDRLSDPYRVAAFLQVPESRVNKAVNSAWQKFVNLVLTHDSRLSKWD